MKKYILLYLACVLLITACSDDSREESTDSPTDYVAYGQTEENPMNPEEYGLTEDGIQYVVEYEQDGEMIHESYAVASWVLGELQEGGTKTYPSFGYDSCEDVVFCNGSYANEDGTIPMSEIEVNPPEEFVNPAESAYTEGWLKLTGIGYCVSLYKTEDNQVYASGDGQRIWIDGTTYNLCQYYNWSLEAVYDEENGNYVKSIPKVSYEPYGVKQVMYLYDVDRSDDFIEIFCTNSLNGTGDFIVLRYDGSRLYSLGCMVNRNLYRGNAEGLNSYVPMGTGCIYEQIELKGKTSDGTCSFPILVPAYGIEENRLMQYSLTENEYYCQEPSWGVRYPTRLADGNFGDAPMGTWLKNPVSVYKTAECKEEDLFTLDAQGVCVMKICYDETLHFGLIGNDFFDAPKIICIRGYESGTQGYSNWDELKQGGMFGWYGISLDDEEFEILFELYRNRELDGKSGS